VEATIQLLSAIHPEQPASAWNLLRDAVREGWQNVDRRLLEHGPLEPNRFNLQEANERAGNAPPREDPTMKFLVQVICVSEAVERRKQVFEMEREHLTMETLGLGLGESKALLRGVQEFLVAEQVAADLERRRNCPDCGERHASKARGRIKVKTVFGLVEVPNPRLASVSVSIDRPKHVPAGDKLAHRTNQSRVAVFGDQVGLADSLRQGCRAPERRVARSRYLESRDRSQSSPRRCESSRHWTKNKFVSSKGRIGIGKSSHYQTAR
jgi:hypothetical protein